MMIFLSMNLMGPREVELITTHRIICIDFPFSCVHLRKSERWICIPSSTLKHCRLFRFSPKKHVNIPISHTQLTCQCCRWPGDARSMSISSHSIDLVLPVYSCHSTSRVNSLWPSYIIWRHGSRSTLAQVMACCLTAPSHYLNQCWLMISEVLWHSSDSNFTENT